MPVCAALLRNLARKAGSPGVCLFFEEEMRTAKPHRIGEKEKARGGQDQRKGQPQRILEKISTPPLSFLVFAAAILVCYFSSISYDFSGFDDNLIITDNMALYSDFANVGSSFTKDAFNNDAGYAFYRPMQNLSFFIDVRLFGGGAGGFRITNLLLHLGTCICVFLLFGMLELDCRLSFLAVLLYAVHPLFNHAVIWIPSRGDLLIALFGTLSYILFLKYIESNRIHYLLLHAAAFFVAVFSKETAILLPLVLAAHLILRDENIRFYRRHLLMAISWVTVIASYLYCRAQVIVVAPRKAEFGLGPLITNLPTIPEFLSKFFAPWNLSVMAVFNPVTTLLGAGFMLLLVWSVVWKFKSNRCLYIVGSSWFILFTTITMLYRHKLGKAGYDYLEHRTYLPMIGILMVLVAILQGWLPRWDLKKLYIFGFAIVIVFSVLTFLNSRKYMNPMTFYASAIDSNPKCALAFYNRAKYKKLLGDRSGAMADYNEAIRVQPDCADAYNNRGNARQDFGDVQGALNDYNEAAKWDPDLPLAYFNRGNAKLALGDRQGAIDDYSKAIALEPAYAKALNNRGTIYYGFGKLDLAYADFERALQINSWYADAWRNRGSVRFRNRDVTGACADWRRGSQAGNNAAEELFRQYCR
jgi:protein O-mannosyl-transferase